MCVCPPKHPLSTIQNAELRTPGGIATNLRQHSTSISWGSFSFWESTTFCWGGTLHGSSTARKCPGFFERSVLEKVTPARGRSERYSSWGLGNAPQRRMRDPMTWHPSAGVKKAKCGLEAMFGCEIFRSTWLGASLSHLAWFTYHQKRFNLPFFSRWASQSPTNLVFWSTVPTASDDSVQGVTNTSKCHKPCHLNFLSQLGSFCHCLTTDHLRMCRWWWNNKLCSPGRTTTSINSTIQSMNEWIHPSSKNHAPISY